MAMESSCPAAAGGCGELQDAGRWSGRTSVEAITEFLFAGDGVNRRVSGSEGQYSEWLHCGGSVVGYEELSAIAVEMMRGGEGSSH